MTSRKRIISGRVIKISGDKSVSIVVERRILHPRYRKIIKKFSKYIVHDQDNICNVGDVVEAIECRPISKFKSFKIHNIIMKGASIWYRLLVGLL